MKEYEIERATKVQDVQFSQRHRQPRFRRRRPRQRLLLPLPWLPPLTPRPFLAGGLGLLSVPQLPLPVPARLAGGLGSRPLHLVPIGWLVIPLQPPEFLSPLLVLLWRLTFLQVRLTGIVLEVAGFANLLFVPTARRAIQGISTRKASRLSAYAMSCLGRPRVSLDAAGQPPLLLYAPPPPRLLRLLQRAAVYLGDHSASRVLYRPSCLVQLLFPPRAPRLTMLGTLVWELP